MDRKSHAYSPAEGDRQEERWVLLPSVCDHQKGEGKRVAVRSEGSVVCLQTKMKRRAVGIWHCGSCMKTVAGGAWTYKQVFAIISSNSFCSMSIILLDLVFWLPIKYCQSSKLHCTDVETHNLAWLQLVKCFDMVKDLKLTWQLGTWIASECVVWFWFIHGG